MDKTHIQKLEKRFYQKNFDHIFDYGIVLAAFLVGSFAAFYWMKYAAGIEEEIKEEKTQSSSKES